MEELHTHPDNPRRGDLDAVEDSLRRFGQVRPVLANEQGTILAGNHTYRAAMERLGWTEVAAVRSSLAREEERAYLLADNRLADLGAYHDEALIDALTELGEGGRLEGTGYSFDDLDDLISRADRVATTALEEFEGGYAETDEEHEAREARAGAQEAVRQLVLVFEGGSYDRAAEAVRTLERAYSTSGTSATILEAIRREFETVWSGAE